MNGARAALLTLVSVYIYPASVSIPTGAFVEALELLGFNERASRQALNRARTAGWLESDKRGRRSVWRLSRYGRQLMDEGHTRLETFQSGVREWDGRIVLVSVSIPENDRQLRHAVRTRMSWQGFSVIAPGLWVSTNLGAERAAKELLGQIDAEAFSVVGTAGVIGDLHDAVRDAWQLREITRQYQTFIASFEPLRPETDDDYFVALTHLVHEWRRFPFIDPGLPGELLPDDWPGSQASQLERELRDAWVPCAIARWDEIVRNSDGQ
jgi:phenylacetic acid degradation operon negative regulatory protein